METTGEVPTWDEIVERHSDRVYRLAYRLTGNRHDAEDLTQEVFVRVFRSLVDLHARHVRGLAAPDHHQPLPRPGPPQAADPVRRAVRRAGQPADQRVAERPTRRTPTRPSTTTSSGRWPRCRRTSAPPSCCATSRACPTRRSPRSSAPSSAPSAPGSTAAARCCARRWPTARPQAGRSRYSGPNDRTDRASGGARRDRSPRIAGERPARRSAVPGGGRAGLGARPRLPRLPRPGRARGLGEDPAGRPLLRRRPRRPTTSRARCSAPRAARCRSAAPQFPTYDGRLRRNVGLVAMGGGAVGAAVRGRARAGRRPRRRAHRSTGAPRRQHDPADRRAQQRLDGTRRRPRTPAERHPVAAARRRGGKWRGDATTTRAPGRRPRQPDSRRSRTTHRADPAADLGRRALPTAVVDAAGHPSRRPGCQPAVQPPPGQWRRPARATRPYPRVRPAAAAAAARGPRPRLAVAGRLRRRARGRRRRRRLRRPAGRAADRRHPGAGLGRPRRRRHGHRRAAARRQRVGRRGGAAAAAEHGPDLGRVRGRAGRRRPGPASCSTGRATSSPTTTSSRTPPRTTARSRSSTRTATATSAEVVGRSPVYDLAVLVRQGRPRPAAGVARRLAGAARRRRRRRDRLPARAQLDRHRRHRQRARPAGHHRRLRQRLVLHQRRADRRRDQPRQLRRPAGRPAGPGRRREQRDRHDRRHRRRRGRQHRRRVRDPDRAGPDHRRPDPAHRRGELPRHRRQGADRRDRRRGRPDRLGPGGHPRRPERPARRTTWSPRSTASGSPTASR